MDRINGFPDELLVNILSFLPTKVAVSTSILSKRWRFLWMWLPKLDYGGSWIRRCEPPRDFIDKNLPLHKAPVIESLRLALTHPDIKPEDVKLWIEIAVSRHVRELEISYSSNYYDNIFPSSLFTCKSLVILKLEHVTLRDVPSMASCLLPLKTLHLSNVTYADEESFQKLLSIYTVLEDLDMSFYDGGIECVKEFNVIVPSLKKLSFFITGACSSYGYEIDTPSLKYLRLEDWYSSEDYSLFNNMPKLMEAYVNAESLDLNNLIRSITSVKHLTICSQDVYGDGIVFNQLEHLKLCICKKYSSNLLALLLKDSPNLRVLDISVFGDHDDKERNVMVCWNQPSHVPECMLSNLQIFNWSGYFGRPQDRDIAVYILRNARHLRRATISADTREHRFSNLQMIKELTLSSRASNKCELVFVQDEVDVIDSRNDDSSDDSRT